MPVSVALPLAGGRSTQPLSAKVPYHHVTSPSVFRDGEWVGGHDELQRLLRDEYGAALPERSGCAVL